MTSYYDSARESFRKYIEAMHRLTTDPGVRDDEWAALRQGILDLAKAVGDEKDDES